MQITISKKAVKGKNESGEPYTLRLELPLFSGETETDKKLNDFYSLLANKLEETAKRLSLVIVSDLHITYSSEGCASFFTDTAYYKNGKLLKYSRISDNRDGLGNELPPPKSLKKKLRGADGFYRDNDSYYVYKNIFSADAEKEIRRSEYGKFFVDIEKIPI